MSETDLQSARTLFDRPRLTTAEMVDLLDCNCPRKRRADEARARTLAREPTDAEKLSRAEVRMELEALAEPANVERLRRDVRARIEWIKRNSETKSKELKETDFQTLGLLEEEQEVESGDEMETAQEETLAPKGKGRGRGAPILFRLEQVGPGIGRKRAQMEQDDGHEGENGAGGGNV